MKFREHRGSREEASKTRVELADRAALLEHIRKIAEPWPTIALVTESTVHVKPYHDGEQIGTLDGYGLLGFIEESEVAPAVKFSPRVIAGILNREDAAIWHWIKREEAAGNIFPSDDGYYVWNPDGDRSKGGGFLNEYALIEMTKYLQARNAAWDWQIQHDPAIGGSEHVEE
jgi:hypothetical protein